jgi:hypothetical protein
MGDLAAVRGCGSAGEGARHGRARAFQRAAMETLLASWQTLTGLAWLAGRITRVLGGYYARAAMAWLAGRRRGASRGVPRARKPG